MSSLLKDLLTGIDGESYDIGRVLWFCCGIAFILFTGYDVYHGGHFDPNNFGIGSGAILGGGGAGVGLKAKTEPTV